MKVGNNFMAVAFQWFVDFLPKRNSSNNNKNNNINNMKLLLNIK